MSAADIDASWVRWVAENLARGARRGRLVDALVGQGAPRASAVELVQQLERSPLMSLLARAEREREQRRLVRDLRCEVGPTLLPEHPVPDAEIFYRHYYDAHRPGLFRGMVREWPAVARWSFDSLAEQLGDAPIAVTAGRESDPHYFRRVAERTVQMPFDQVVARALEGVSNDLYVVSRNRAFQTAPFDVLLADLDPVPSMLDPERLSGAASLWLGPAGTVTPLHHDCCNILFTQVYGEKRVVLIPPDEAEVLAALEGPHGPPAAMRLQAHEIERELTHGGLEASQLESSLPYQYVVRGAVAAEE